VAADLLALSESLSASVIVAFFFANLSMLKKKTTMTDADTVGILKGRGDLLLT